MPVDPVALQHSVEQLMAGVGASGPGWARPLSAGLEALIDAAEAVLGVDCVGVLLLDEDDRLRSVASSAPVAAAVELAQERTGVGPGVDTVRRKTTVAVADLRHVERYAPLLEQLGEQQVGAIVSAPIWVNGAVAGNLNAIRGGPYEWTADDVTAVETYAHVLATLLQFNASSVRGPAHPDSAIRHGIDSPRWRSVGRVDS